MMKKKVRKPKKPKPFKHNCWPYVSVENQKHWNVGNATALYVHLKDLSPYCFYAKDCRKLAKWLISAADYLEARGD